MLKELFMIFSNLSILQNILFIIACLSVLILLIYFVLSFLNYKNKNREITDDIDSSAEVYESFWGFLFNAFKIKGSVFFVAFASCIAFVISIYLPVWAGVLIGIIVGFCLTLLIAFLTREPLGEVGELAIVSVDIPEKNQGSGKVILLDDNMEVDAESLGKPIKKGKKVIVKEHQANKVFVEKK